MIRNQANQTVGAQMISATTGAAFAGTVTVYVTGDAGTQAIGSVALGICTLEGNGFYTYRPAIAETNYDSVAFTFVGVGAIPSTVQVETLTVGQVAALASGGALLVYTGRDLATQALNELMVYGPGDSIIGDDAAFVLSKLTRLLDKWNAIERAVWGVQFQSFPITPALQPHTIGPLTATWTTPLRPNTIDGANLIVGTVRTPVDVQDAKWWLNKSVHSLASTIPTDLYYENDWPNGNVFLWPVPQSPYILEIMSRTVIAQVGLNDVVSFPPGYLDAIILTLAEMCATPFEVAVSAELKREAQDARAVIFDANTEAPPKIATRDSGMPGGGGAPSGNYLSGWFNRP